MLIENGFVRLSAPDGSVYTFNPSFARIASLGHPHEIVALYAELHGAHDKAILAARYVLACLCEQDDVTPLTGWLGPDGFHPGMQPDFEQITIALHLMNHGTVGKSRPGSGNGEYSEGFSAAEYIASGCIHLELSREDAENLSMQEFHTMLELKNPELKKSKVPSREEYRKFMGKIEEE